MFRAVLHLVDRLWVVGMKVEDLVILEQELQELKDALTAIDDECGNT